MNLLQVVPLLQFAGLLLSGIFNQHPILCSAKSIDHGDGLFQINKYSIFTGYEFIKIQIFYNNAWQLHSTVIAPSDRSNQYIDEFKGIDREFYRKLLNSTQNFYALSNYVAALGLRTETTNKTANAKVLDMARSVRFAQWAMNAPLVKIFEELLISVQRTELKDGFFVFLLKYLKIDNGDLAFYCKFQSLDNCYRMYDGVNIDLATRTIIRGACSQKNVTSASGSTTSSEETYTNVPMPNRVDSIDNRKFLFFCLHDNFSNLTYIRKINQDVIKGALSNNARGKFKQTRLSSNFVVNNIFRGNSLSRIPDYKYSIPMEERQANKIFLDTIRMYVDMYEIDLMKIVFDGFESYLSTDISQTRVGINQINNKISIITKLLCANDPTTCALADSGNNIVVNNDYIYEWGLRIKPEPLKKSFGSILNFNKVFEVIYFQTFNIIHPPTSTAPTLIQKQYESVHFNRGTVSTTASWSFDSIKSWFYGCLILVIVAMIILLCVCFCKRPNSCHKTKNQTEYMPQISRPIPLTPNGTLKYSHQRGDKIDDTDVVPLTSRQGFRNNETNEIYTNISSYVGNEKSFNNNNQSYAVVCDYAKVPSKASSSSSSQTTTRVGMSKFFVNDPSTTTVPPCVTASKSNPTTPKSGRSTPLPGFSESNSFLFGKSLTPQANRRRKQSDELDEILRDLQFPSSASLNTSNENRIPQMMPPLKSSTLKKSTKTTSTSVSDLGSGPLSQTKTEASTSHQPLMSMSLNRKPRPEIAPKPTFSSGTTTASALKATHKPVPVIVSTQMKPSSEMAKIFCSPPVYSFQLPK